MKKGHQFLYDSLVKAGCGNQNVVYFFETEGDRKKKCFAKDLLNKLSILEKEALTYLRKSDRILDAGAGGGRISRYLQVEGYDITALDKSTSVCEALKESGIKRVVNADILNYHPKKKFTAVLLVKTYSIFGRKRKNIGKLAKHLRERVLDRRGRFFVILNDIKSGESEIVRRRFICAGEIGPWFISLHPSFRNIAKSVQDTGFKIEKFKKNKSGEYFLIFKKS